MTTQFTVTNEAELNAALAQIDVGGASAATNTAYKIIITADLTGANALSTDLDAINLASGSSLTRISTSRTWPRRAAPVVPGSVPAAAAWGRAAASSSTARPMSR
jgi:hypothetical protein